MSRPDPARLVFIDETSAKTNMTCTHGRARRCEPPAAYTNLPRGAASNRIDTPCAIGGPIKGKSFRGYAEQTPIPTLKPDDIIIDNLGSPDLNPVQQAKSKTLLRNEAGRSPNARKANKTAK